MGEENVSQEFWVTNVDETRHYWRNKQKSLMSKKHKNVYMVITYI